jgi:hypothetical protein
MLFQPEVLKELRIACQLKGVELFVTPEHLLDLAPTGRR